MKILQVCAYAAPYEGNFIATLKHLDAKLKMAGHQTIYAFPENARTLPWCMELAQCTSVYFLPLAKARIRPATYCSIRKIFSEHSDIAVAHSHFELYDVPVLFTAPKTVKVFWHLHDAMLFHSRLKAKCIDWLQYGHLHGRAKLISISEANCEYVVKMGFPRENSVVVPNGINLQRYPVCNISWAERQYDFMLFGWEFLRKAADVAIKAISSLPYTLVIVGNERTETLVQQYFGKVPENVRIIEPVKDVSKLYAQVKCFLHISRAEGGIAYALEEAVAAGLPVIVSDVPTNKHADDFPTVTMIPNENVSALKDAMRHVMDSGMLSAELVEESRKVIAEKYSLDSWAQSVRHEYGL